MVRDMVGRGRRPVARALGLGGAAANPQSFAPFGGLAGEPAPVADLFRLGTTVMET